MDEQGRPDRAAWEGELFRLLVENVVDYALFVVDPEGMVRSWSHGAEQLLGYREAEILGRSADLFFTPEDVRDGAPSREIREARESGRGEAERWHVRKDGTRLRASGVTTPLLDEAGRLRGFARIMRDRTEWWHADRARREGEERHRAILESITDAFYALDRDWRFTYVNRQAEALLGRPRDDLIGKNLWEEYPATIGTVIERNFRRAMGGGETFEFEEFYPPHDRWYANHLYPSGDGLSVYFRDVTGRKVAEDTIRERERFIHRILEASPGVVYVFDLEDRRTVFVNDGARSTIGVTPEEVKAAGPRFLSERVHPDDIPGLEEHWGRLSGLVDGEVMATEYRLRHADGRWVWFSSRDTVFQRGPGGLPSQILGVATDITDRKAVEGRLVESEGRFRTMAESIPQLAWMARPDGHIDWYNRRWYEYTGTTPEDMQTRGWRSVHEPDLLPSTLGRWQDSLDTGEPFEMVFPLKGADGTFRPFLTRIMPVKDVSGRVVQWFGTATDIAGQKQAEERLQEAVKRFHSLVTATAQIVWTTDPDGQVIDDSPTWRAFTGQAYDEWTGWGWLDAIHPDDRDQSARVWTEAVAGRTIYQNEYRVRAADGAYRWTAVRGVPVLRADGEIHQWVGMNTDITDRKKAEEERQLLASLVENSPDFIGVADLEGRPIYANRAGMKLIGADDLDHVRRTPIPDYFVPEERAFVGEVVLPAMIRDGRWTGELTFRHFRTGASIPVLYDLFRVDDPSTGRPINFATVTRDITDRRRVDEELRAAKDEAENANKAKDQFLAVLSHELRTPLNPILLAASSMLERPVAPEEVAPALEMIRQNVNLQARLIDDLLDVMRIVQGKMPLHWGVSSCHDLIARVVEICRSEVQGKAHRLVLDLAAADHHVNADSARLHQVLWNLVKNAVKFTPEGGTIAVRTRNVGDIGEGEGGCIVVEVSDTGIGIEPDVMPAIFDPFQQGETTVTRRFGGLGLGLAICKGVVEAHGGALTVESGGKDRGSTFRVALKTIAASRKEADPGRLAAVVPQPLPPPERLNILLVEDEPSTLRLLSRLLTGLGHRVTAAGTVADAWSAFEGGAFDLIISDLGLPDGSGLDLMRKVKSSRRAAPAIALTGYGMDEDIRRSREAGFTAHMTKPIDFTKLEAMIRQVAR